MDNTRVPDIRTEEKRLHSHITLFACLVWVFIALGVLVGAHGIWQFYSGGEFKLAALGDYVGGSVASLWSLAGLFLIYIAFLGQKLQLLAQQEELVLNREELKATRAEFEQQNDTLRKQRFENTFFQLLKFHHDIVEAIDLRSVGGGQHSVGRSAFEKMYRDLRDIHNNHPTRLSFRRPEFIRLVYRDFFKKYQPFVGHYFRSLYNIVKFVHLTELLEADKKIYTNLIRAQLSSYELLLLFYNCLSDVGKNFHPWVEQYNLLKTAPTNELLDASDKDFYPNTKFD